VQELKVNSSQLSCENLLSELTDMFLFAKLVMLNLSAQPTRLELQEEIGPDKFPRGLGQA
jgi:hypothetical protein